MKKLLLLLPVFIVAMAFSFSPVKAFAAYDPDLVITDAQFSAKNAMSEAQIQEFLVAKGSFLANYTVPAPRTVTYYISATRTLTTYENSVIGPYGVCTSQNTVNCEHDVRGWKASRVIWQVSQWYGVNPQVVLTIIEKESNFLLGRTSGRADGSIASVNPVADSYATYAWMLGYAYTEDVNNPAKNVCGTATPGANPTKSCAGLAAQLDNATWAAANWTNLANSQSSGNDYPCPSWTGSYRTNYKTRLCDGDWITPRSGATAALYRYTPHTGLTQGYSGNKAFYLIFTNWFSPKSQIDGSVSVTSPLRVNNELSYTPRVGQWINYSFSIRNDTLGILDLREIGIGCTLNNDANSRCDTAPQAISLGAGEVRELIFTTRIEKVGSHYSWIKINSGDGWFMPSNSTVIKKEFAFDSKIPNIQVTTYSVNKTTVIGEESRPSLSIRNNEFVDIDTDLIGVGGKINSIPVRAKDFKFSDITLGARSSADVVVDIPSKYLSETGRYTFFPVMKIGGNWIALKNLAGLLPSTVLDVREPNIKASWFLVPSTGKIGQEIRPELTVQNFENVNLTLTGLGVAAWLNYPDAKLRDFEIKPISLPPNSKTAVTINPKIFSEAGDYRTWPVFRVNNNWFYLTHVSGWPPITTIKVTEPNLKATWFLVPEQVKINQLVQPELKIRNFENVDIRLDSIGVAAWLGYPSPNIRDFGYAQVMTLAKNSVTTIPITPRSFTEAGDYRAWAIFRVGQSWFAPGHISGWPTAATMSVGN